MLTGRNKNRNTVADWSLPEGVTHHLLYQRDVIRVSDPNAEQRYGLWERWQSGQSNANTRRLGGDGTAPTAPKMRVDPISHSVNRCRDLPIAQALSYAFITTCLTHRSSTPSSESHYHVLPNSQET